MQTNILLLLIFLCIYFIVYCFSSKYELFTILTVKDFENTIETAKENIKKLSDDNKVFERNLKNVNSRIKSVLSRFLRQKCSRTKFYVPSRKFEYNTKGLYYNPTIRTGRLNRENKCEVIDGKITPCQEKIKCLNGDLKEIESVVNVE